MALARWIDECFEGMQRLGHVKALVTIVSPSDPVSLKKLNSQLKDLLTKHVDVTPDEAATFSSRSAARRRYAAEDAEGEKAAAVESPSPRRALPELQDFYLVLDNSLPSATGNLNQVGFRDSYIPIFGRVLGIISAERHTLTPRGKVLLNLMTQEEIDGFRVPRRDVNPYKLSLNQQIFFLYCLLDCDGDVLRRLGEKLLSLDETFSRAEAGRQLGIVFREMSEVYRRLAQRGDELATLRRWKEYADAIENQKPPSHAGVREQRVTMRLEALVDVGLLEKDNPHAFKSYRFSEPGRNFLQALSTQQTTDDFLRSGFFGAVNEAYGIGAAALEDMWQVLGALAPSYQVLRSPLRYAPIEETALMSAIQLMTSEQRHFFEREHVMGAMLELRRMYPDDIRFNIDQFGKIRYIKLGESLLSKAIFRKP